MPDNEKIFIVTDECAWEKQKQEGTEQPHFIVVVDIETGETRQIKGGAKIKFVEGEISEVRSQEEYNKQK